MQPRHPLLGTTDVKGIGEAEFVVGIVVADKVVDDRYSDQSCMPLSQEWYLITKTLLDREAALVVIYNDWDSTVGTQLCIPWLLLDVQADTNRLPGVFLSAASVN